MKIVTSFDYMAVWQMWSAVDDDTYDLGEPIGRGVTEQEAIGDLLEQIEDRKAAYWIPPPTPEDLSRSSSSEKTLIWMAYWAWRAA